MTITIGDLLVDLVQHRDDALALDDPVQRQEKALDVVQEALFIMHKLLGEDLLTASLGEVDEGDRAVVLRTAARRLHVLSAVFGKMPADAASPIKVVAEAMAIASGDAPLLFARIDGHKVNHRIAHAKFQALKWDVYLKARGLDTASRRIKIEKAFGHGWDTIRRGWRRDVAATLSDSYITYFLNVATAEGRKGEPYGGILGIADWESALASDGANFREALRENNGNR